MLGHISTHHFLIAWRSEPPSLHTYGVKSYILGVQSHRSQFCAFKATISSQLWRLEPLSLHISGIQSHCLFTVMVFGAVFLAHIPSIQSYQFLVRHSKPPSLHSYGVQSCILGIQSHRSQFGVQSRHSQFSCSKSLFTVWCLESSFTVWHVEPLVNLAFRATIFLQFDVQSHIPSIQSYQFLVQYLEPSPSSIRHLELSYLHFNIQSRIFSSTFRVIGQLGIQSHHISLVRRSKPHSQYLELSFSLVRHSEPYFRVVIFFSSAFRDIFLAFRVVIFFWFGVQRHIRSIQSRHFLLVLHSELSSSVQEFKDIFFSIWRLESYFFSLVFRGIAQFRHLDSPYSVQAFKAILFNLGIQSHLPQFRCSEPPCTVLSVQSHPLLV